MGRSSIAILPMGCNRQVETIRLSANRWTQGFEIPAVANFPLAVLGVFGGEQRVEAVFPFNRSASSGAVARGRRVGGIHHHPLKRRIGNNLVTALAVSPQRG